MTTSLEQKLCQRLIDHLTSINLECAIYPKPFDPNFSADDIIMSALSNQGVVLVMPGDCDEYQSGHGQTQEKTMWRQIFIQIAIYNNASLFPQECLSPEYFIRAIADTIEGELFRWNPFPFHVSAGMMPKVKSRKSSSVIIDAKERQMSVLSIDVRIPVNIEVRNKI